MVPTHATITAAMPAETAFTLELLDAKAAKDITWSGSHPAVLQRSSSRCDVSGCGDLSGPPPPLPLPQAAGAAAAPAPPTPAPETSAGKVAGAGTGLQAEASGAGPSGQAAAAAEVASSWQQVVRVPSVLLQPGRYMLQMLLDPSASQVAVDPVTGAASAAAAWQLQVMMTADDKVSCEPAAGGHLGWGCRDGIAACGPFFPSPSLCRDAGLQLTRHALARCWSAHPPPPPLRVRDAVARIGTAPAAGQLPWSWLACPSPRVHAAVLSCVPVPAGCRAAA
jgi:hypothetical protein